MTTPTPTEPPQPPPANPARRRFRITRDGILFVTGLAGIVYETLVNHGSNPTLLILFGAMVGLPAFLHADEFVARRSAPPPSDPKDQAP